MKLSQVLDVNHSNVYVRKAKIIRSITILKGVNQQQKLSGKIQIPYRDIHVHLHDLDKKLRHVELAIKQHEQLCFPFLP